MIWRIPVAMLATALLLLLALPPLGLAPAGAVAAVPLLLLADRLRSFYIVAIGLLTGFMAGKIASIPMLPNATHPDANDGWIMLGLTLFGLLLGVFAAVWSRVKHRTVASMAGLAAMMVLLEWVTLTALPLHLGLTQYRSGVMLLLASVGGIWLVSFLLWFANLILANQPKRPWVAVAAGAALLLPPLADSGPVRVAAIQTEHGFLGDLHKLHSQVTDGKYLTVWPELSAAQIVADNDTSALAKLSRSSSSIVTTFRDEHQPLPHNVAGLFYDGREVARYEKRKPFAAEAKMHAPGKRIVVAEWRGVPVGLNICFDSCYPAVMRDTALAGAAIIALPTLDPNSPNSWIQAIHDAYGNFRAAELGVSIVRADIISHSSIITRFGATQSRAGPAREEIIYGLVATRPVWTVYKGFGDWALCACLLGFIVYLVSIVMRFDRSLGKPTELTLPSSGSRDDPLK